MNLEEKKKEFLRKGNLEKVKFLDTLHLKILPQQVERIQRNDKTVLKELVIPKWLSWDMLFEWATQFKLSENAKRCCLCEKMEELGILFIDKWICYGCFLKLKEI